MIIQIVRDLRTGGEYDAEKDTAENGDPINEVADIEVQVSSGRFYRGSNSTDDPSSAEVGEQGIVLADIPKWDIKTREFTGEFLFRAGQTINLTANEIELAHEQALEEARDAAENPE